MITHENYFKQIKLINTKAFPDVVRRGYLFTIEATEDHSTWKYYKADKKIKEKIDFYLKVLNQFLRKKPKERVTEAAAKEAAKEFIRPYVQRGDSLSSLSNSQMGHYGGGVGIQIRKRKIEVEKLNGQKVNFSFPLPKIYVEVMHERGRTAKEPVKTNANSQKQAAPAKSQKSANKPVRIDYSDSKPVERISDELKFIKRFLSLHNKTKTKGQILNFLNALQRAIVEKRIRKTSQYADEIMKIQKQLVTAYDVMQPEQTFTLGEKAIKQLSEIVGSARIRFSTQYLKRFIGIQGKTITKDKAQKLHDIIAKAISLNKISGSDPYFDRVKKIASLLKQFTQVAKKNDSLELHQEDLNGLDGVLGCMCQNQPKEELDGIGEVNQIEGAQVMSVDEARQQEYKTVEITGKWLELIGKFCLPTQFFVYGPGGGGKSSFVLLFTQYLASLGYRILYVAGEQFNTPTFTALLNRLNIVAGANFQIVGKIDTLNPADFDFIVLDSKDQLEIKIDDFLRLKEKYSDKSFIVLSQGIKTGSFTGKERWRNIVDVMVQVENGIAKTGIDKNRWGGIGEMKIL